MRIIGPASADRSAVFDRLGTQALPIHPRFAAEMFHPLWDSGLEHGVDPVGVVAQAYKETGGGNYLGKVRPEFCNTCGLKIRYQSLFPGVTDGDNPLAHAMFANWEVGARAHVQHLCAYAGQPVDDEIVDPRYVYVVGKYRLENFEELGGKWAPSLSYGNELVAIARRLQGSAA